MHAPQVRLPGMLERGMLYLNIITVFMLHTNYITVLSNNEKIRYKDRKKEEDWNKETKKAKEMRIKNSINDRGWVDGEPRIRIRPTPTRNATTFIINYYYHHYYSKLLYSHVLRNSRIILRLNSKKKDKNNIHTYILILVWMRLSVEQKNVHTQTLRP